MQQLISVWFAIDARKRAIVALSVVALFATVLGLSRLATSPNLSLLYSGLEPATAGDVVKSLEQQGVVYEVRGDSIFVSTVQRDQLRMQLAAVGLPASSGQGYEILDTLSGFGTTAQMFDAAYWRAREGELARTIAASPQFRSARVHISNTASLPFRRPSSPTASVTVISSVNSISGAHAKAIKFLVASAVAGMLPADVSIIDGSNGTVVADETDLNNSSSGSDRAATMRMGIERLLEARVGSGNAIVEVFLDLTTERETLTERSFDPDSRVAISTEKEERSTTSNNTRGSNVTVASNLPEGDGVSDGNSSSAQDSEITERTNYEVSQTTRELLRTPGSIRRLSIAVLVEGVFSLNPETNTQTWAPRSDSEMSALRELVASAAGIDESRGDTLTLKTLQFQSPDAIGNLVEVSALQKLNIDVMRLIQLLVLGSVSLVLGLFVLRPILTSAPVQALPGKANIQSLPDINSLPGGLQSQDATKSDITLTGEIDESSTLPPNLANVQQGLKQGNSNTSIANPQGTDAVARLRDMIADREDETVDILRTWIDGPEEKV